MAVVTTIVSFDQPLPLDQLRLIFSIYGQPFATDQATLLYNVAFDAHDMRLGKLANAIGQHMRCAPARHNEHVTLRDERTFRATSKGWTAI